jgi:hypothetical protein
MTTVHSNMASLSTSYEAFVLNNSMCTKSYIWPSNQLACLFNRNPTNSGLTAVKTCSFYVRECPLERSGFIVMIQSNISCGRLCATVFAWVGRSKSRGGTPASLEPPSPVVAAGSFPSHVRSAPCSECALCCLTPKTVAVPLLIRTEKHRVPLCLSRLKWLATRPPCKTHPTPVHCACVATLDALAGSRARAPKCNRGLIQARGGRTVSDCPPRPEHL